MARVRCSGLSTLAPPLFTSRRCGGSHPHLFDAVSRDGHHARTMTDHDLELWLARHGETTASVGRQIAGWLDAPLTDRGRAEARALRPLLEHEHFDGTWSSDLSRAVETANLAKGPAVADPRLREVHFGELEGQCWEHMDRALERHIAGFRDFTAPGGEHLDEARTRFSGFIDDLPPGRHLIFAHGGVIRLLTQDLGFDAFLPTGSLLALAWRPRRLLFVRLRPGGRPFGGAAELDLSRVPLLPWPDAPASGSNPTAGSPGAGGE
jgi:2,3-bisphosphoglycerate-dependent phosphoglycerate mutase